MAGVVGLGCSAAGFVSFAAALTATVSAFLSPFGQSAKVTPPTIKAASAPAPQRTNGEIPVAAAATGACTSAADNSAAAGGIANISAATLAGMIALAVVERDSAASPEVFGDIAVAVARSGFHPAGGRMCTMLPHFGHP